MTRLSIHLLGPLQITLAGEVATGFDSDKVRALLAFLSVEVNRPHRRERLAGLLWPEYPERSARTSLRRALANLRQVIDDQNASPPFLAITRRTIQFNRSSDYWLDVGSFSALAEEQAIYPTEIGHLEEAITIYRGVFLEGFFIPDSGAFEEWSLLTREDLQRKATGALRRLVEYYEDLGAYDQALEYARKHLELEPLEEMAHNHLMRILALSGNRSEALAQYETCRDILEDEFGVEPTSETMALYGLIRTGDMGVSTPPAASIPRIYSKSPGFLEENLEHKLPEKPVFVARERELSKLKSYLEIACDGRGRIVFVTGGAGRGKTALLREFIQRSLESYPELLIAQGNCSAYSGVGDPYFPFREIMDMLTGDVEAKWAAGVISREHALRLWNILPNTVQTLIDKAPGLIGIFTPKTELLSRAMASDRTIGEFQDLVRTDWSSKFISAKDQEIYGQQILEQQQIFQQYAALLNSLAACNPLMLVLDDLQWVDTASSSLLFHLGRSVGEGRILIVGAYRPDEVALARDGGRHPLEQLLSEFKRRFGDVWIDLAKVERREEREFVHALLDVERNRLGEAFRRALFQRTKGHPLFTIELLRAMEDKGNLLRDFDGLWIQGPSLDWDSLPARMEGVIQERIDRLNRDLCEILRVASVEGESFTAQIVAQVLNMSERELLWMLTEELEKRHRLVRARGETFFDHQSLSLFEFTHSMFHQYLYNGLNPGQQRLLHGEIAQKLEVIYQGRTDEVAIQLARHFEKARKADKAIHYLLMAGDRARRFYAQKESIEYYQRALDLLRERDDYDRTARTLMKLGLTYHNAFDFKAARETFQEGFVFWQRLVDEKGEDLGNLPSPPHPLRVTAYEPAILGLGLALDFPSHVMLDQLYSGLVEVSPEMGLVPDVAQSWEVLDGGRKYIFQLKKDVYWSDGVQVTAWDFECAWQRILAPTSELRWHIFLTDIKYADAYHNGKITDLDMVGVRALDDFTLVVELEGPTSYFPYLLAFVVGYPVPRHVVKDHGDSWMELDKVVTNGPFRLKSWDKNKALVLERNPTYHGRFTGNLESVECTFLSGQPTRILQRYEQGRLDICGGLPLADFTNFRQRFADEYMTGPWMSTDFIGFDVSRPPFNDVRVRRAFALATDREKLADVILRGYAFPATGGFVPPGMPGHSPGIGLPYDPKIARTLLAKAGFNNGSDFPVVECLARDDPGHDLACDFLQVHWKETLGVEIKWRLIEWGNFYDLVSKDTPHMCMASWYADYPDPDDFLRILWWFTFSGWQNENYTSLVEGARRVLDQAERMNMYKQADKIIIEEVPLLPLSYGRFHMLVKPWVKKLFTSPLKWWSWKDVIIEHH